MENTTGACKGHVSTKEAGDVLDVVRIHSSLSIDSSEVNLRGRGIRPKWERLGEPGAQSSQQYCKGCRLISYRDTDHIMQGITDMVMTANELPLTTPTVEEMQRIRV
jgi:hypothetical protein